MTKHVKIKVLMAGICLALLLLAVVYWMEMTIGAGAPADYTGAVFAELPMNEGQWIQLLSI